MGAMSRLSGHWRNRRVAMFTVVMLAVATHVPAAHAADPSQTIVLPPRQVGDVSEPILEAITLAVVETIGHAGASVKDGTRSRPCPDSTCVADRLRAAAATLAVVTTVEARGPDRHIIVRLHDGKGAEVSVAEATCELCGLSEAANVAADVATIAWRRAQRRTLGPAHLEVRGMPVGALVEIDGEPVGLLPYDGELPPGSHEVTVSRRGYFQRSKTVAVADGDTEAVDLSLVAIPPQAHRRARRLRVAGLSSLGGGLLLGGVGAALFVGDGREYRGECSGADVDADGDCRQRWNTMPGAITTTSFGAAALITGAVLLGLGGRADREVRTRGRDRQVRVRPTATGVSVCF